MNASRLDCALERIAVWGTAVALVLGPSQWSLEVRPKTFLSPVDPLLFFVFLAWSAWVVRRRSLGELPRPPLLLLCFLGWTGLSFFKAAHRFTALKDLIQLGEYFLAAWLLFGWSLRKANSFKMLTMLWFVAAAAVIGLGLFHYFDTARAAVQVRATYGNARVFGGFMSLALPLCCGVLLWGRSWPWRIAAGALLLTGSLVVLAGATLLALALACLALTLLKGPRTFIFAVVALVILAVFILPLLPHENSGLVLESLYLYDADNNVQMRYTEWQACLEMIREQPLLGVGIGNYQDNINGYYGILPNPGGIKLPDDTQNLHLVLASTIGMPGYLFFAGLLLHCALCGARSGLGLQQGWRKALLLGSAGSLTAFLINAIWSPLLVRGIGIPLVFVCCLALYGQEEDPG